MPRAGWLAVGAISGAIVAIGLPASPAGLGTLAGAALLLTFAAWARGGRRGVVLALLATFLRAERDYDGGVAAAAGRFLRAGAG